MSNKTYLTVCIAVTALVAGSILFVPGLSESIEQNLLIFLSTNAR